jgi:hypothetical protein
VTTAIPDAESGNAEDEVEKEQEKSLLKKAKELLNSVAEGIDAGKDMM